MFDKTFASVAAFIRNKFFKRTSRTIYSEVKKRVTSKLSDQEINDLKVAAVQGITAWNKQCDAIKFKHGGYPMDWSETVIMSGIMAPLCVDIPSDNSEK